MRRATINLLLAALPAMAAATAASEPPAPPADYAETIPSAAVTFEMVWVEEGGFWIARTETTWDAYLAYCAFDDAERGADAIARPSKPLEVRSYDHGFGKGDRPAIGMSWNAAKLYCQWLSKTTGHAYRLPTEAEWRLACGDLPADPPAHAWCAPNSDAMTHPVGTREANALGVHDMLGNVWEYCADPYDPRRPDRAVLRGGSWRDETLDPDARLPFNSDWTLDDPNFPPGKWWIPAGDHIGFRVLRDPDDEKDADDGDGRPTKPTKTPGEDTP